MTYQYCEPDALASMNGSRHPISSIMRPPPSFGMVRTNSLGLSARFKRYPPAISFHSRPKRLASHEQSKIKTVSDPTDQRLRTQRMRTQYALSHSINWQSF